MPISCNTSKNFSVDKTSCLRAIGRVIKELHQNEIKTSEGEREWSRGVDVGKNVIMRPFNIHKIKG